MKDFTKEKLGVVNGTQHTQSYTIVRIKRKRTDEPLDALGSYPQTFVFPLERMSHVNCSRGQATKEEIQECIERVSICRNG